MNEKEALTVGDLRVALARIPAGTKVVARDLDSGRDGWVVVQSVELVEYDEKLKQTLILVLDHVPRST